MKCNVCGRQTQNEEANFCEYCGSSFRERMQTPFNTAPIEPGYQYNNSQSADMAMQQGNVPVMQTAAAQEKPVSFLNYLGSYSIFFIPIAGWLIFIVMLFVWAFSENTPASKKNWARATLIFVGIFIVAFIGYMIYVVSTPMFRDMMNGTFDYSQYYQGLGQQ